MRITALFAFVCSSVAAQVTSPQGLGTTEGSTVFFHWGENRRFQQIDYTQNGAVQLISSISWRRDGNFSSATWSRTFDLQIDLGRGDFAAISSLIDDNFIQGTRTTVFNAPVNFPDWSMAAGAPAPFDLVATLTSPYVYTGTDSLVIDFSHTNNTSNATLSTDRHFVGSTSLVTGTALGTGCVAGGNTAAFSHTSGSGNYGTTPVAEYGLRLRVGGTGAPATGGVLCLLDVTNQNVGGILCSTLYPGALVVLPMTSLPTGLVPDLNLGFTHQNSLVGLTLYTQLVAPDATQTPIPVVVSNGRQTTISASVNAGSLRCAYGWHPVPSATNTATMFVGGGMVMQLQ